MTVAAISRANSVAVAPAPAAGAPLPTMVVDPAISQRLSDAVVAGTTFGTQLGSTTSRPKLKSLEQAVHGMLVGPPAAEEQARELAYMHGVARTRTPEGVRAAVLQSAAGYESIVERGMAEYATRVSPEQARAGAHLVHDVIKLNSALKDEAKDFFARPRPFEADPTLPTVVPRPNNNPSFPSGHTSGSYAAALTLASLMPDRREQFLKEAEQVAWSRTFGGVHYPSDIVAGAKLGAAVATAALKWHAAGVDLPKLPKDLAQIAA